MIPSPEKWRPNGFSRASKMLLRPRAGSPFDISWIWDAQGLDFEAPGGAQDDYSAVMKVRSESEGRVGLL